MITVIIPAYNRPDDLRRALYSLAAQSVKDFRVIVSDDHSDEPLGAVCYEFNSILNITYARTPHNMGCGGNRRFALEYFFENPTEYVMFLDSDDALVPQAIQRLGEAITNNDADLICTDIIKDMVGPVQDYIKAGESRTWLHGKIYRSAFLKEHNINFPAHIKTNEDLAFNLSIYAYDPDSYLLSEPLYFWRFADNSITHSNSSLKIQQGCRSVDYIEAIYWAFGHYTKTNLSNQMKANIINCYTYYQNGIAYGTLQEVNKQHVRKMLHHPQVAEMLVKLYGYPDADFQLKQWCIRGDELVFYGQTFGQWIMQFFKPEEIKELIQKSGLQK